MQIFRDIKGGSDMFLAAAAGETTSTFNGFDIFILLFTVILVVALFRLIKVRPKKNLFAIGFTFVSLLVFLATDYAMINAWFS